MASAGLLKVLHSGLQDERLLPPKGQPQMNSIQQVFTKAGRFTTEWYRVDFDNRPSFGTTAKATLPRRGHLITRAFLMARLPDIRTPQLQARAEAQATGRPFAGPTFGWTNSIGHALVGQAQLTIGASPIDTIDSRLLEVLDEFHTPLEKLTTVNRMLGRHDNGFTARSNGWETQSQEVAVPLPFWFNRGDPAAALPIDAIGSDTVQISITFNPLASLFTSSSRQKNANGNQIVWPALGSKFYTTDPSGSLIYGLNGNPDKAVGTQLLNVQMPSTFSLQDTYLLLEYVYLDKPEANRIRLGDISYPMVQHYAFPPYETPTGTPQARIRLRIPNPTRELYFQVHRTDADGLNAPFLATRDLSGLPVADISGIGPIAPWWPDADGLTSMGSFRPLIPAYSVTDSEPITSLALSYEGKLVRYASDHPAFFRSILPAAEQRKTPWHNKYLYHLPFGTQHEFTGITNPMGHANLDKIQNIDLSLQFKPFRGSLRATDVPAYSVYVWAETYNILRVYGGRAGLMFAY